MKDKIIMVIRYEDLDLIKDLDLSDDFLAGCFIYDVRFFDHVYGRGIFERIDSEQFVRALEVCRKQHMEGFQKLVPKLQARGDEFISEVLLIYPDLYDDLVLYGLKLSFKCWWSILTRTNALDKKAIYAGVFKKLSNIERLILLIIYPSRGQSLYNGQ